LVVYLGKLTKKSKFKDFDAFDVYIPVSYYLQIIQQDLVEKLYIS